MRQVTCSRAQAQNKKSAEIKSQLDSDVETGATKRFGRAVESPAAMETRNGEEKLHLGKHGM